MPAVSRPRVASFELLEELSTRPIAPARQAGLGRARRLLSELGDPQNAFRSICVAGSAGKGSTATMIEAMLRAKDRRTGLLRSPHLSEYRERLEVAGQDIGPDAWEQIFSRVWPIVERMQGNALPGYALGRPSFSEVLFALSALHFAEEGVEWAVLEAGMGARFDATNTVWPAVAVVTNVSLEHTAVLGHTVAEIAREKSAIFKSGSRGVTAAAGEALDIVREQCREEAVPLLEVPGDIHGHLLRDEGVAQLIALRRRNVQMQVRLRMLGEHQIANAATAFAASLHLREIGLALSDEDIRGGLERAWIPGRLELVSGSPSILMDGAQSVAGSAQLAGFLRSHLHDGPRVLLFASMSDKDTESMARNLAPLVDSVVVTRVPGTDRSANPAALAEIVRALKREVHIDPDALCGLRQAEQLAGPNGQVVIAGSLYLVGALRRSTMIEGIR